MGEELENMKEDGKGEERKFTIRKRRHGRKC